MGYEIEIHQPGRVTLRAALDGPLEVGREASGLCLDDAGASRHHARIESADEQITVTDLGSRNGTWVNGGRIEAPTTLADGDTVRIGATDLVVRVVEPEVVGLHGGFAARPAAPLIVLPDDLVSVENDAVVASFRPGSAGERAAASVLASARRARRKLRGFGSESWGRRPHLFLVEPFPDPDDPANLVGAGTVVDPDDDAIWMVVTDEVPPEPVGRPLALLFGASLPAADDLTGLIEGYGLVVDESPDVDVELYDVSLPPLTLATGELATRMNLSFVRYLCRQVGAERVVRFFGTARPGRLDEAADEGLGGSLTDLERAWKEQLKPPAAATRPIEFVRLSARLLRPHLGRQLEIFALMVLGLLFSIVFPFITQRIFDDVLLTGRFSEVVTPLLVLCGAFVVWLLAGLRRTYVTSSVSLAVVRQLRTDMFAKLQRLRPAWLVRHQQGDVLGRLFGDVNRVETALTGTLADGVFNVLSLIVSSIVMLTLNLWLGLLVLAGVPVVMFVYTAMGAGARRRSLVVQDENGKLMGLAAENYTAQQVVKLFGLHRREVDRFSQRSARLYDAERGMYLYRGLFGLSVNTVMTALRMAVLGIGIWMITEGTFTIGGLVAFLGVMGEVLTPASLLTGIGQQMQSASGSLARIRAVLDEPGEESEVESVPPPITPLATELRLDSVSFAYDGERRVLDGVSVEIAAGTRVAFVGPSGSGKSTLLRLLMRLYEPDAGRITVDGKALDDHSLASWRDQLGVVFQDTFLFDTTIRENIALGSIGATDDDVLAAARAAEVDSFVASLPGGYETHVGEGGAMLSGGQRQRVALARALVRNPRLLLLDEATSALDPGTERQIASTLTKVGSGRTTVAITHRLRTVVDYDQIVVLVDGMVAERGTHRELLSRNGAYAALWAEQDDEVASVRPAHGRRLTRNTLSTRSISSGNDVAAAGGRETISVGVSTEGGQAAPLGVD